MAKMMITGATGELGGLVINHLLKNKKNPLKQLVALARKDSKHLANKGIEVEIATYDDIDSLNGAFSNIDKLLIIPTQELDTAIRMQQLINVLVAAKNNAVKHIVYVSFSKPEEKLFGVEDIDIAVEHILFAYKIPYTILRNPVYFDELRHDIKIAKETGKLLSATKDKKFNYSLKTDLALAIATVLTEDGHQNKLYDLSSDELMNYSELAEILTTILDTRIIYEEKSGQQVIDNMIHHGVEEPAANLLVNYFHTLIAENKFDYTSNDLKKLLNGCVTSKKDAVKSLLN